MMSVRNGLWGRIAFLLLFLVWSSSQAGQSGQKLVLIGGGDWPPKALTQFAKWSGGPKGHVLVLAWGTDDPQGAFNRIKTGLSQLGADAPGEIEAALIPGTTGFTKAALMDQFAKATGFYFCGGDQAFIMTRVDTDPDILPAFTRAFQSGIPFAGTSAGTAVMANTMITGNGDFTVIDPGKVETRNGLGFTPGYIVDQHFIKRQRENRIFSLMQRSSERIAFGIDESNAVSIEDNRYLTVLGSGLVLVFDNSDDRTLFNITILSSGDSFDIVTRRRVHRGN